MEVWHASAGEEAWGWLRVVVVVEERQAWRTADLQHWGRATGVADVLERAGSSKAETSAKGEYRGYPNGNEFSGLHRGYFRLFRAIESNQTGLG